MKRILFSLIIITFSVAEIPEYRVVAEWEPALGTMIRWPLGIPSELIVELAEDDRLYVLVENTNQENLARNNFNSWNINMLNIVFIFTESYSHWTRDHGPQFLIGENHWEVVNQEFNGYPVESGCEFECDEEMILLDCIGDEFCNNQPQYATEGYDCYINNELCEDFNGDGQIMDWLGDGYCDDGNWGLDFMCDEYSWDCGDCGGAISDEDGYCDDDLLVGNRDQIEERPLLPGFRGWEEDDDTNIDFANQMNWDIQDLPLYWTGGNFMTDGYGMGFSTELMINENNMDQVQFSDIIEEYLYIDNYHIFDNPNEESIQHIDCLAKLVNPETIIIKQVPESSPEYECMEEFAQSFYELNTFYDRPFNIYRILCPEINGGNWETNPVAAYTNSLILNNKVLVPQYDIPEDIQALGVYQEAMPGYEVIGFDGSTNNPWLSEDALHCRAMGVFDPNMIHMSHKSIRTTEIVDNSSIYIDVEVIDYSNFNIDLQSVLLHWKYSAEDGPFGEIPLELESDNIYTGTFPALNSSSSIEYFITSINMIGDIVSHPNVGWHIFNTLEFLLGDINGDNSINIQDIVLVVNLVLAGGYNNSADLNFDSTVDILDIIQIVNYILDSN
jgi:agmatine/peptidylarginine deiminase